MREGRPCRDCRRWVDHPDHGLCRNCWHQQEDRRDARLRMFIAFTGIGALGLLAIEAVRLFL